ncbi:MAG: hypothetical protein AAF039_16025 [Bacteroidota bacterium]
MSEETKNTVELNTETSKTEASKARTKKAPAKKAKVKIILPVAGRFKLPYNLGQTVSLEAKQAEELIKAKYAEKA